MVQHFQAKEDGTAVLKCVPSVIFIFVKRFSDETFHLPILPTYILWDIQMFRKTATKRGGGS